MGSLTQKNRQTPPRAMASDRSLSSALPSSRAPHESPCLATAGAGCSCTTQWLLPSRSARPRERFSDLLTMIGGTTNLFGGVPQKFLGPQSWPFGAAVQHTGSLGIMCLVLRRQSGARRGRQRCRRRGHRDHGAQTALVVGRGGVAVLDIADPQNVQMLSQVNPKISGDNFKPGRPIILGTRAVLVQQKGLAVVDFTDRANVKTCHWQHAFPAGVRVWCRRAQDDSSRRRTGACLPL